jgi:hypothetical protein
MRHSMVGLGPGLCLLLFAALACDAEPVPTYHADVKPILERSCVRCHSAENIGPFQLDNFTDASAVKDLIAASAEARTMPPWLAGPDCDDYVGDPTLSDEEIATLRQWADGNAPEGDPAQAPAVQALEEQDFSEWELDRVDLSLELPLDYAPTAASDDDYRCFPVAWPETSFKYATGFAVRPGNKRLVHHVIAYVATPEEVAEVEALDAADEGAGYDCYGGPGFGSGIRWLGAWAPGGIGSKYPPGTGLGVEPGSMIVLQMHYNLGAARGETDRTAIDVQLADSVEKRGFILPFTNPTWLSGETMHIPADDAETAHWFDVRMRDFTDSSFMIYTANMHMHTRGNRATLWMESGEGDIDCLLDVPRWDFDWQLSYAFSEPKVVTPDDKLGIECRWDNSGNPDDLAWGDGTGDEMCLGIFFASEM